MNIVMPDGDPSGVKVIEKSNWSGAGLEIPRPLLLSVIDRDELSRPGVYVLVGPPQESELPTVYVGESDVVRTRITQHDKQKDFWTHAIVFTSSANRLNKAHVRYLESSLVAMAVDAKRCNLENGNSPQIPALSEADVAEVSGFMTNLLELLGVLGHRYFEKPAQQASRTEFEIRAKSVIAHGYESSDGFVVKEGSEAVAEEVASIHGYLHDARETLVQKAILESAGESLVFTQDFEFSSPSTAAGVVLGSAANGRTEWKTKAGLSLKELQTIPSATG